MSRHRKLSRRQLGLVILSLIAVSLGSVALFVHMSSTPPKESALMANFYEHRAVYEQLRDMLQADKNLLRVASWGVETTTSIGISKPPQGNFPPDRYGNYLELLRQVGAIGAFRGRGEPAESVSIIVWASGWAGNTRHVHICWLRQPPQT